MFSIYFDKASQFYNLIILLSVNFGYYYKKVRDKNYLMMCDYIETYIDMTLSLETSSICIFFLLFSQNSE